jgi:hypothetical protein
MLAGKGVMVNWSNWTGTAPEFRQSWRGWHSHHMLGRLKMPGFIRGRRYGAVDASRDKMTFYELETPAVLASDAYRQLAKQPFDEPEGDPSRRNSVRNIAAVNCSFGPGATVGGFALTLRLEVDPGSEEGFSQHLAATVLPAIVGLSEIIGAHYCISDAEASNIVPTSLLGRTRVGPRWIVMVEGMTAEAARAAFDRHLSTLHQHGVTGRIEPEIYQLELVMTL